MQSRMAIILLVSFDQMYRIFHTIRRLKVKKINLQDTLLSRVPLAMLSDVKAILGGRQHSVKMLVCFFTSCKPLWELL